MNLKTWIIRVVLGSMALSSSLAWATHPLITDDTKTQGPGKFQFEASGTWLSDQENKNGEGARTTSSLAVVILTAGIVKSLDVMVTVPYVWTETREAGTVATENGFSDTIMEAKWRFYEKHKLSVAIKPGIFIPTGDSDEGLGTGHVGYSAFMISTVEAEPWEFHINLGYLYLPNSARDRSNIWLGSLASEFEMSERWKIVGEVGASRNTDSAYSSEPVFAQVGLIYSPKESLDLSAGYLFGLNNAAVDQSVRAGVTVRF